MAGGDLTVESELGKGTTVTATMQLTHLNRPPMGDMVETMVCILMSNPEINFIYTHRINGKCYRFDSTKFERLVDDSGTMNFTALNQIKKSIQKGLDEIGKS